MTFQSAPSSNSPLIVAHPTEPQFVVLASRLDAPHFGCGLQVSGSGGRGWIGADPVPRLPPGAEKCYAPEVAFDSQGSLYFLFVGLRGAGNEPMGAFMTISKDRGKTFAAPWRVLGPLNFGVRMAIDQEPGSRGRIHLVWLKATSDPPLGGFGPSPNPILHAYSQDGGKTFSNPVQVSDPTRKLIVAPAVALGHQGEIYIAYFDLKGDQRDYYGLEGGRYEGTWSLVMSVSSDGGRGFRPGVAVDDGIVPHERVMLIFTMPPPTVAAGEKELVCVGWTDARLGDPDALARCSNDGGKNWSAFSRLNDDQRRNGRTQLLPRLAIAGPGRVDAIFFDRRRDPEDIRNDVYFTSAETGKSFSTNTRLTSESSDSRIGQQYGNISAQGKYELGSRLGLLSSESAALAVWPDSRNYDLGTTGQDLFSTRVAFSRPQSRSLITVPTLLGLGLVFFALAWVKRRDRSAREG